MDTAGTAQRARQVGDTVDTLSQSTDTAENRICGRISCVLLFMFVYFKYVNGVLRFEYFRQIPSALLLAAFKKSSV